MTQDGQVVHGDDERHRRTERSTVGWAVENVDPVPPGGTGQRGEVPAGIPGRRGQAARTARRVAPERHLSGSFQRTGQVDDVARRAGARLRERRHVHPDGQQGHRRSTI
jgi:hypothetical protein